MALYVPQVGALNFQEVLLGFLNTDVTTTLALFTDDLTPDWDSVFADFTEPTFDGYSPVVVDDFVDGGDDVHTRINIGATVREFTLASLSSGGADIYGYFVYYDSGNLLWAERFTSAPITLDTPGQAIRITPRLTDGNCS